MPTARPADSLASLQDRIIACHLCPRLVEWRERVGREKVRRFADHDYWAKPVPSFGDPRARLLVIGLAPAAHGGNRTGRVFTGDRSGDWLFRVKIYLTNQTEEADDDGSESEWWSLSQVLNFYAYHFIGLLDGLRRLEQEITKESPECVWTRLEPVIDSLETLCSQMRLRSSVQQIRRVRTTWSQTQSLDQTAISLRELSQRIRDDLMGQVFYQVKADKHEFFAWGSDSFSQVLVLKPMSEIFGMEVLSRFGEIHDDLYEACRCYVYESSAACVFHLMRAVEVAIPKIAKLCGMDDSKPSWGSVLSKATKLAFRTEHKDLPENLKSHADFLRDLVNNMNGMQRSWRNKIDHLQDSLIVKDADFNVGIAYEILISTRVFLQKLAKDLPVEV